MQLTTSMAGDTGYRIGVKMLAIGILSTLFRWAHLTLGTQSITKIFYNTAYRIFHSS